MELYISDDAMRRLCLHRLADLCDALAEEWEDMPDIEFLLQREMTDPERDRLLRVWQQVGADLRDRAGPKPLYIVSPQTTEQLAAQDRGSAVQLLKVEVTEL